MGYTHYFGHGKTSAKKWNAIVEDCKKLQAADDTTIVNNKYVKAGAGWKTVIEAPKFNTRQIRFNGIGEDGHEDFILLKSGVEIQPYEKRTSTQPISFGFTFCKTARKPYDTLVCACLLVYKYHSEDTMSLSSDGDEEWEEAEQFVKDTLGYDLTFKEFDKYKDED